MISQHLATLPFQLTATILSPAIPLVKDERSVGWLISFGHFAPIRRFRRFAMQPIQGSSQLGLSSAIQLIPVATHSVHQCGGRSLG